MSYFIMFRLVTGGLGCVRCRTCAEVQEVCAKLPGWAVFGGFDGLRVVKARGWVDAQRKQ